MKKQIISIVTPVFNDWESLEKLIKELVYSASTLMLKLKQ